MTVTRQHPQQASPTAAPSKLEQRQAKIEERKRKQRRDTAVAEALISADLLKVAVRKGDEASARKHIAELALLFGDVWPGSDSDDDDSDDGSAA